MSYTGTTTDGPISHFLGGLCTVLERYDEADTYLTRSASFSQRVGAKFFGARTDLLWAWMLSTRSLSGDLERARVAAGPSTGRSQSHTGIGTLSGAAHSSPCPEARRHDPGHIWGRARRPPLAPRSEREPFLRE